MLHISTWMRPHRIYCATYLSNAKSERERHNCKCILWVRERINESFNKRILRNKMLKRQTNKLITVECFLTLHSPICSHFLPSLSLFSRAVIYWTMCRPSRKVEMRDKFNNQYFSNFNWNACWALRKANELMRRKEKSKALSGFHFWIYKIDKDLLWMLFAAWLCERKPEIESDVTIIGTNMNIIWSNNID